MKQKIKKFWEFLKEDSWQSFIVSLFIIIILIRFILFPLLSFITASPLPLVLVESCSMYHHDSFDEWWEINSEKYSPLGISKEDFEKFQLNHGLNKGDIVILWNHGNYEIGDIAVFTPSEEFNLPHPIIHRIVETNEDFFSTLGDNGRTNPGQAGFEKNIPQEAVLGKAVGRIPYVGWIKLIFFEPFRQQQDRGFC